MEKWNTIFKLKKETNSGADLFLECDWICTDFGFMLGKGKDLLLVMQPLQRHPHGKQFGLAPTGLSCYMVTDSQLYEIFEIQEGRSYWEEQKKYRGVLGEDNDDFHN